MLAVLFYDTLFCAVAGYKALQPKVLVLVDFIIFGLMQLTCRLKAYYKI